MEISLVGKNAIICGSTQGIGKAVAEVLAENGANVCLIARNKDKLLDVKKNLKSSLDQKHSFIVADFTNPDDLKSKINEYTQNQPSTHILVNNTGGPPGGLIVDAEVDNFLDAYKMHLVCNHILVKSVVEGMKSEKYGRIINIISTSVKQPILGLGVSNTTRAAVASWSKTLANELGQFGITVNNVLPGSTDTQRLRSIFANRAKKNNTTLEIETEKNRLSIPAKRFADPRETAFAVAFLASPAASYINGINLPVDGGRTTSL